MSEGKEIKILSRTRILVIGILFLSIYALAYVFQETLWGVHHFTFLPSGIGLFFLALAFVLMVSGFFMPVRKELLDRIPRKFWLAIVLALAAGWVFHNFPIHKDYYGDAPRFKGFLGDGVDELNVERTQNMLSLDIFDPKIGEKTMLNAVERLAFRTQAHPVDVFRWIDTVSGTVFVLIWLLFLFSYVESSAQRLILILIGLFAPFTQNFYGHIEIYAPFFAVVTGYFSILFYYLKTSNKRLLWALIFALILCIKFHFLSVLLIPSLIAAFVYVKGSEKWKPYFTWKSVLRYVLIPVFIIGWLAYFFVFKDHNDPRFLDGVVKESERLFLPLMSPDAPLDRYNLFSFAHISDFVNNCFHWAGAGLFVLIILLATRKRINWNTPEVLLTGVSLILFNGLLFMVNPLLSMPIDWDLFSLSAPLLLFLLVAIMKSSELELRSLVLPTVGVCVMAIPVYMTNAIPDAGSKRLEVVGRYTFKTYWIRSAGTIDNGIGMESAATQDYIDRLEQVIDDLKPYAHEGDDIEYAYLLWSRAKYYRSINDLERALRLHQEVHDYAKKYPSNRMGTMDAYYRLGRFDEAFEESKKLVAMSYPDKLQSLSMAIDCGLKAKESLLVLDYCEEFLKTMPTNAYVSGIRDSLRVALDLPALQNGEQIIMSMQNDFIKGDFESAYEQALQLVALQYPDRQRALRMAIHCALEGGMYDAAKKHCEEFITADKYDRLVNEVNKRLSEGDRLGEIKFLFGSR